ncbi:regulator of chromosome condensation-like protein [Plasmopara halstedii]|uniref:Regulator of chromosome condensation-like protein n=1 Tax=Plasmopara halstedii TaxID=4781 RepID=A0A0P1B3E4_PLAHL|nr:regulator of chromosome condensation-like protein [Plasmopara halstedii]CEG48985.1 regulator of chromosome condensation-like protein [Plasmopara halstedii]|eukprot:XP_024585354.1 regulator of chromosome condensation-like protein [Plasmopara halstedii]
MGGSITFGQLTNVQMLGFYQARYKEDRKSFLAYVLQVNTTTSHFLVYRRYSQIASLATKLHFHPPVGLPPKYAMQLYPLTDMQLQQRFEGLKGFLHAVMVHLSMQHATGLHHATNSRAGLDMQLFCDFVVHHRNRPPKPVTGDIPNWAQPIQEVTDHDSITDSDDMGLLESDGSDVESDDLSTSFRNEVLQIEGNVGALWHSVRAYKHATVAWWEATSAVFDEYKRVADVPQLGTKDSIITRLQQEMTNTLDLMQLAFANTCDMEVLPPLEKLRHDVLPEIKHSFWTRHEHVQHDTVATTRRVQQERKLLHDKVHVDVHQSLTAFVAFQTRMLRTIHQKLHDVTTVPRPRSKSMPTLSTRTLDHHSQLPNEEMTMQKTQKDATEIDCKIKNEGTPQSRLWVWGRPPSLESGTPLILRPKQVAVLPNQPLIQIACGGEHLLYLTSTGDVYTFGNDEVRKMALSTTLPDPEANVPNSSLSYLTPQLVEELALEKALYGVTIAQIACGAQHSVAITNCGELYTWGSGEDGRLGHGDMRDRTVPRKVMTLLRQNVVSASCGGAHTVVLTEKGSVFSFGRGRNGRLGLGDTKWRDVPHEIMTFPLHMRVVQVACGWNFTTAIGQNGTLCTWGKTGEGQCGIGYVDQDQVVPAIVKFGTNSDVPILDVACGYTHTLVLTANGTMYSWGLGEYGQLGTGNVYEPIPAQVHYSIDVSDPLARVYCGAFHSIATTEHHVMFTWGLNLYGACGLGHTTNKDQPERLDCFSANHDLVVACGHKYTFALELALNQSHVKLQGLAKDHVLASHSLETTHFSSLRLPRDSIHEKEEELRRVKKMWRTRILRNWEANKNSALTHALWRQGIPPSIRARVWPLAIGNQLKVTPEMFQMYRRRAIAYKKDRHGSEESQIYDGGREHTLALIDTDLPRTFPSLKLFDASGPYYTLLLEVLETYACFRPDLGYIQGMSYLAAMLCLHMPQDRYLAFQCLANLMVHEHLFTFYLLDAELASVYYTLFEAFLEIRCSQLLVHFRNIGISSCSMYLMNWLQTLFLQVLPLESAARVFDNFLLDGTIFLFRIAMAIHELLAPQLLTAEMDVVLPLLQHNIMYQTIWHTQVSEQALFEKVSTIAVPTHIYAALDRVINDVFFYEKRNDLDQMGNSKMMMVGSGRQSIGIGHMKHERRSFNALNGVLGGF